MSSDCHQDPAQDPSSASPSPGPSNHNVASSALATVEECDEHEQVPVATSQPEEAPKQMATSSPAAQGLPPARPPRARHPIEHIDNAYLATAVYTMRPGIGKVYDWNAHHRQNEHVMRNRKQHERDALVIQASQLNQKACQASQEAFRDWMWAKQQESVLKNLQRRSQAWVSAWTPLYSHLEPKEQKQREAGWQSSTWSRDTAARLTRAKVIYKPGQIAAMH